MKPLKILFVCVENSCRSQIAEAFARTLGIEAWSSGSKPSGTVHPMAIEVMRERGFDLSGQRSKGLSELPAKYWDCVVTMGCGDACPNVAAKKRVDWRIADPKAMPKEEFHKICALIETKVRELIAENMGG